MEPKNDNIRTIRKLKGKTQEEMAFMMDVQRSSYGRFERGKTNVLTPMARRFIKATGIDAIDLFVPSGARKADILASYTQEDLLNDLVAEVKRLRSIVEMLAGEIDKLSKKA